MTWQLVGLLSGTEHGVKNIIVLKKVDDVSGATNLGIKVLTFDEIVEMVREILTSSNFL